jgi:hypothetical protein
LAAPMAAEAGKWKGTEETIDGALHIKNPTEAMDEPMTIELEEVYRLGGWSEDQFFGVITGILEDEEGNVYLLDSQLKEIQVYDSAGSLVRTIGREGEAPGEFQIAGSLFWMPDGKIGVMQTWPGRIVQLGTDGTPYDDFTLPPLPENETGFRILFGAARAGDKLAIVEAANKPTETEFTQTNFLNIYDPETQTYTSLYTHASHLSFTNVVISETEWDSFRNRWIGSKSGRVYCVNNLANYAITVYNPDGALDRVIERDVAPVKRTSEEVEKLKKIYEGFTKQMPFPNKQYDLEPNHPAVTGGGLYERPDGSLWVRTSVGTVSGPDDELGGFDIYDPKGRYVRRVILKGQADSLNDAIFFVNDRIYVITEFLNAAMALQGGGADDESEVDQDAEPMSVICYRSDQLLKAAGIPKGKSTDSR